MVQLRITGLFTLFCPAGQTGPVGGSGFRSPRSVAPPTAHSTHILPALVAYLRYDASQSPYRGWQNVVNSRNVRREGEH
jgi:hypothetical protein